MAKYPKRDPFYAHQVVRRMTHVCAAQEIGSDAFVLVTIVVHTEDAKRYTGPVTWWNAQLQSVLGFGSWDKVDRARKRAIKAGWLHYESGGKGKVGKYWANIPEQYADLPDGAVDADEPVILRTGAETNQGESPLSPAPVRKETGDKPDTNLIQTGEKPGTSCEHSTLSPKPTPKPPTSSAAADGLSGKARELLRLWNATPGIKPARSIGPSRVESLNARMTEDARWWDSVPIALDRIGKSSFCRGGGDRRWVANIKWFLQRETMNKILEGEYDEATGGDPIDLGFKIEGEK